METEIKRLRVSLDALAQFTKTLYSGTSNHIKVLNCENSLYMAKAWAGKLLGEYEDNTSPYQNEGNRHSVEDIEPTDSVADINGRTDWDKLNRIERIDSLRQLIGKESDNVKTLTNLPNSREAAICRTQIWIYLCEARFHLGFELERMRGDHPEKDDRTKLLEHILHTNSVLFTHAGYTYEATLPVEGNIRIKLIKDEEVTTFEFETGEEFADQVKEKLNLNVQL